MGNARLLSRALLSLDFVHSPIRVAEIGCGDGTFMLSLAKYVRASWPRVILQLVDRQPAVERRTIARINAAGWEARAVTADAFDWVEGSEEVDVVVANLFLHHFSDQLLARLFVMLSRKTGALAACEPRRFRFPNLAGHMVGIIGSNAVTRHDARASVAAGFVDQELSRLWSRQSGWELQEAEAGLFSHVFLARQDCGKELSQGCSSSL